MSTRWAGHRRRKPVHGYKAHIATDEEGDIIRCVEVTTANLHDGTVLEALLPVEPGDVYADSAYAARRFTDVILDRGGRPHMVQTGTWGGEAALQRLAGVERCGSARWLSDREGVWHLEAQLWAAADALVGTGQGQPASEAHGRGLQPAPFGDDPQSTGEHGRRDDGRSLPAEPARDLRHSL
jgi:hypothetical protein